GEVAWLLPTIPKRLVEAAEEQSLFEAEAVWWAAAQQPIHRSAWSSRAPVPEDSARRRPPPIPAGQPSAPIASLQRTFRRLCSAVPGKAASERRRPVPLSPPALPQNGK